MNNLIVLTKIPVFKLLIITIFFAIASSYLPDGYAIYIIFILLVILSTILLSRRSKLLSYIGFAAALGVIVGVNTQNVKYDYPEKLIPEFKAAIEGTVTQITKRDSNSTICILHGTIDTPELPKIQNTKILLKIYGKIDALKSGTYIRTYGYARIPNPKVLPTDFDEVNFLAGQGINWLATVNSNNVAWNKEPINLYSLREKITTSINQRIELLFGNGTDGLVRALVLGDKSGIEPETRAAFSISGTAHVLALSGLHVGIIAFILFTFLNYVPSNVFKIILFSIFLIVFVFITGFQPSAIRASFMAVLIIIAKTYQRDYHLINVLSFVVLLSIIFQPYLIYSAGFQMSVAAIFGISLFFEPTKKVLNLLITSNNNLFKYLKNSLSLTLSASAIVSPIVAYYFNIYSIISPLANIFIIPLITFAYIFSLITILLSYVYLPIAVFYSEAATFLLLLSEQISYFTASFTFSAVKGETSIIVASSLLIFLFYIVLSTSRRQVVFRSIASGLAILLINLHFHITSEEQDEMLIYPRNQMTTAILKIENKHTFVYLADRKPAQMPRTDYGLIRFLEAIPDSLTIAVNGNAGINTADYLRERRRFGYIELSPIMQDYIENSFFPNTKLSQIIEIKR